MLPIRWMLPEELNEVRLLETQCFGLGETSQHFLDVSTNAGLVLRSPCGTFIFAYITYTVDMKRNRVAIHQLLVAPRCRRRGLGTQLLERLTQKFADLPNVKILVRVEERNLPAQLFLQVNHFRAVKILRETELDLTQDAYLFQHFPPSPGSIGTRYSPWTP